MPALTPAAVDADHAPFRPRLARVVTLVLAVVVLVLTALLVLALPNAGTLDRAGFAVVGLLVVWFCWRQASVRAVPDADGLTVRNLMVTTRLTWPQIVSVRFGAGRPWVQLDLDDGDTLAVMAIQSADGVQAAREASRLATLVARHSKADQDD